MSDFAFAPNGQRRTGEASDIIGGDRRESHNGNYVPFAFAITNHDIIARFWSFVRQTEPDACWLWNGNCAGRRQKNHPDQSQHGQFTFTFQKKQYHVYAHRFAYALVHGAVPATVKVLHRCDCPPCCNERHLFDGTQADNVRDAANKGRLTVPRTRALSLHQRVLIYQQPAYRGICVALAQQYGVTKACISLIRSGRFLGSGVWSGTKQPGVDVLHTTVTVRRTA